MEEIQGYMIIAYGSMGELTERVLFWLKEGYLPLGGIAVILEPDGNRYYHQALIHGTLLEEFE